MKTILIIVAIVLGLWGIQHAIRKKDVIGGVSVVLALLFGIMGTILPPTDGESEPTPVDSGTAIATGNDTDTADAADNATDGAADVSDATDDAPDTPTPPTPTPILEKKLFDMERFEWSNFTPHSMQHDPFGNEYYKVFAINDSDGYGKFYLGGQYKTFTAKISPGKDFNKDYSAIIEVYADDRLVASTDRISRETQPFIISADISGASYLRIARAGQSYNSNNEWHGISATVLVIDAKITPD